MRIAIIGGSSFGTPNLLKVLASKLSSERMEVVLASRSCERLAAVERVCHLLIREDLVVKTESIGHDNWQKILGGADSVVIQLRVGGFAGRLFDETFPNKYDLCGDEGLGAGGLSAGWRTWPVLAPILEAIATFCPQAIVILLTAPLSPLVRASLNYADLNLIGICELPWTTLEDICASLSLQPSEVQADYLGVNHLGWFFNIRAGSRDLGSGLAGGGSATKTCSSWNTQLLRSQACLPTRYLRMHYEADRVLTEQKSQIVPRAEVLRDIQNRAYETYRNGQGSEIDSVLEQRPTPWYTQAVGPLLLALDGQEVDIPFFLSGRNGTYVPFLSPDDIVESSHYWRDGSLQRSPLSGAAPQHVVDNLVPFVQFERAATEAIMKRAVPLLREALSVHPWVDKQARLEIMVEEIVTTNDAMLMSEGGDYERCAL
jgi:6-phospho-beta-glucosidase